MGLMSELVKRPLGWTFRMSCQQGLRVLPFSSKKVMNRSRMVALSISALLGAGGQSPPTAKRKRGSPPPAPRVPLHESLLGGSRGAKPPGPCQDFVAEPPPESRGPAPRALVSH